MKGSHRNNLVRTKSQSYTIKEMDMWCKIGSQFIDLSQYYKTDIVEHNGDIIEVEYKGIVTSIEIDRDSKLLNPNYKIDIKTDSGYIIKDVLLPKKTLDSETYKELCYLFQWIENKKQNNIGNFDIKENYRKFCNEKEKIMECVPFKTFTLRNLIYKYNMQENYPNLLKIIE